MKSFFHLLPLLIVLPLTAAPEQTLFTLPEKEAFIEAAPEGSAVRTIRFPALKRYGKETVVLVFDNSVYMPTGGGWNGYTQLTLNGKALGRYTASGDERLLRRGTRMTTKFHKDPSRGWWEGNTLLTLFGPGVGEVGPQILSPREEGYTFWIDVTDAVHFIEVGPDNRIESAKENELRIAYSLSEKRFGGQKSRLRIGNLRIIAMPPDDADRLRPEPPFQPLTPSKTVLEIQRPGFSLRITEGGGAILCREGDEYHLSAAFSHASVPSMKFNTLSTGKAVGQPGWQPRAEQSGNIVTITAEASDYTLRRTLTLEENRVRIDDALTNHSKLDVGIKYVFEVSLPGKLKNRDIYMGGIPSVSFSNGIGDNPTLFVQNAHSGLGVMALDDVFRNHLEIIKSGGNTVSMDDEHSALKPAETYIWRSLVYVTRKPDYFAFLNALRRDLGRNQTVIGPFSFDLPESGKFDVTVSVSGPWFEWTVRGGKLYSREEYAKKIRPIIADIKKKKPGILFLPRMETNIVPLDKTGIPGGDKFPASCHTRPDGIRHYGEYGCIATREQTEIVKKSTSLSDSLLYTADGRVKLDGYYASEPRVNLLVQVEEGNSRYRNILDQMRFLKDTVQVDGFYLDQFEAGVTGPITRVCRCSYDRWDGRTVDLSPNGTIARKFYDFAITGNTARANIMRFALDNHLVFIANNQAVSESTANIPAMRFHEFENDPVHDLFDTTGEPPARRVLGKCQLSGSPVTLGIRTSLYTKDPMKYGPVLNRAVITALRHGILYYHYHSLIGPDSGPGIFNFMFPMTPVELGKGFIAGKERVLTAVSRKFVTPVKPLSMHRFDQNGNPLPACFEVRKVSGGWETDIRLRDWEETAALILQPPKSPR